MGASVGQARRLGRQDNMIQRTRGPGVAAKASKYDKIQTVPDQFDIDWLIHGIVQPQTQRSVYANKRGSLYFIV